MKQLTIFAATLVLTCFALFPCLAHADDAMDDLDVTMIIVDDADDLDEAIAEMRGPDDDDIEEDEQRDEEQEEELENDRGEDDDMDDDMEDEDDDDDDDDSAVVD